MYSIDGVHLTCKKRCASNPVLPGGRNSSQKAHKGLGKKRWPEEFVAEFWPNFTKSGRREGLKKVYKEFTPPSFKVMTNIQRQRQNLILIYYLPFG
jgi:hypothetical protein